MYTTNTRNNRLRAVTHTLDVLRQSLFRLLLGCLGASVLTSVAQSAPNDWFWAAAVDGLYSDSGNWNTADFGTEPEFDDYVIFDLSVATPFTVDLFAVTPDWQAWALSVSDLAAPTLDLAGGSLTLTQNINVIDDGQLTIVNGDLSSSLTQVRDSTWTAETIDRRKCNSRYGIIVGRRGLGQFGPAGHREWCDAAVHVGRYRRR